MSTSRSVCNFYFTDCGDGVFTCKQCNTSRKQAPGSGYSNLLSHLATKHPDHLAVFEASQQGQTLQDHGLADTRTMEIFKWIEWVIMRNLPLSEVDDTLTRGLAGIKPVPTSSTYEMLKRYVEIRDAIKMVQAVEDLVPRPTSHRRIVQLLSKLDDLDSVCVKLQSEELTLADVRLLFDAVVVKYPVTASYLKADASIVHSPGFERTVVKVQGDRRLQVDEEAAVKPFLVVQPSSARPTKQVDFATATLRQAKKPRHASAQKYDEMLSQLPPTSNRCERLFSQCKLILTPRRSSLLPANFEMLVFLRANRDLSSFTSLVGIDDV
ncbi:hypothetical protein AM587_10000522 [Phytophthora nicotianae]|uniref:BED-type domain-containing protein n=1 Tax=Phytophthora nicotianae TaxID=4792 RepID=A0A0W8CGA2_PHYNI|nr:hypothetical protein AM587_10000522 [Phytophthora nicotianae]